MASNFDHVFGPNCEFFRSFPWKEVFPLLQYLAFYECPGLDIKYFFYLYPTVNKLQDDGIIVDFDFPDMSNLSLKSNDQFSGHRILPGHGWAFVCIYLKNASKTSGPFFLASLMNA